MVFWSITKTLLSLKCLCTTPVFINDTELDHRQMVHSNLHQSDYVNSRFMRVNASTAVCLSIHGLCVFPECWSAKVSQSSTANVIPTLLSPYQDLQGQISHTSRHDFNNNAHYFLYGCLFINFGFKCGFCLSQVGSQEDQGEAENQQSTV